MIANPVETCEKILRLHGASEIYLFGSRAKGTATEDSDVDLAVRGIDPSEYYAVVGELLVSSGCSVDLVMLEEDTPFAAHLRDKIERGWITRVG
jgi:predicted nucleotidyltransferase